LCDFNSNTNAEEEERASQERSRKKTYENQKKYRAGFDDFGLNWFGKADVALKVNKAQDEADEFTDKIKKDTRVKVANMQAKTAAMRNELVNKKRLNYFGTQYNIIEGADESTPSLTGGIGVSSQKIVKLG